MADIHEIRAYKVNDEIYETEREAKRAQALEELKLLVDEFYYRGIDERGIVDALLEYEKDLKRIFDKI